MLGHYQFISNYHSISSHTIVWLITKMKRTSQYVYLKYLVLDFHVDGHEKRNKAVRDAVKQLVAVTGVFRASKPLYVDPPEGVVHHSDGCLRLKDFLPELLEASLQGTTAQH